LPEDAVTVTKPEQALKASLSMPVAFSGNTIEVNERQYANPVLWITFNDLGNLTDFILLHSQNAPEPMVVTPSGIVIESRAVQL
jgi:hypothetical protein